MPTLFTILEPGLFGVLFTVALKTGMRQGEPLALTWGDVDLTEAVIRVSETQWGLMSEVGLGFPRPKKRFERIPSLGGGWGSRGWDVR